MSKVRRPGGVSSDMYGTIKIAMDSSPEVVHVFLSNQVTLDCPLTEGFGRGWSRASDDAVITCLFCLRRTM